MTAAENPRAVIGSNSRNPNADVASSGVAAEELKQFIERLERMEEEKKGIAGDIKEIYAEAKGRGFDTTAIRTLIRLRKKDKEELQEQAAILELYAQALGMDVNGMFS